MPSLPAISPVRYGNFFFPNHRQSAPSTSSTLIHIDCAATQSITPIHPTHPPPNRKPLANLKASTPTKAMELVLQELQTKLQTWPPDTADRVRQSILELIELADLNILDIARPREIEQDVLDAIDEP